MLQDRCLIQSRDVYGLIRPRNPELRRQECLFPFFLFHLFQGIRDHIRPVSKTVKKAVAFTGKPGIGAEDKLAAVKIPDHFGLQRLQGKLFVLVSGIQVKGKWNAVGIHEQSHGHDGIWSVFLTFAILFHAIFRFDLEIIVGAVIVKNL